MVYKNGLQHFGDHAITASSKGTIKQAITMHGDPMIDNIVGTDARRVDTRVTSDGFVGR